MKNTSLSSSQPASLSKRVWRGVVGLGAVATIAAASCGPKLDPISEIRTLRIMGVQKSAPYARPGESVDMHMLWEDGRGVPDKVESFFGFWCLNPAGDSYAECLAGEPSIPPQFVFNQSNFTLEIPEDSLRTPIDPRLPDYGTAFVFYGLCAGTLSLPSGDEDSDGEDLGAAFLPQCLDEDGEELGPDDFIIGYSQIFIYEDLRNENPIVTGFKIDGKEVEPDCIGLDCDGPFDVPPLTDCVDGVACLETCEDDGDSMTCDPIEIEVVVDPASEEQDALANIAYGTEQFESMWVSYFVDRGAVFPELKLIVDAETGLQDSQISEVFAPKEPGPLRLWAVVRDNRGGTAWVRVPAFVKEAE